MADPRLLANPNAVASVYVAVTKADVDLPNGICRALWVGTAGAANLMRPDGTIVANFPLIQGPNPIAAKQVRVGGSANDIWAIYE